MQFIIRDSQSSSFEDALLIEAFENSSLYLSLSSANYSNPALCNLTEQFKNFCFFSRWWYLKRCSNCIFRSLVSVFFQGNWSYHKRTFEQMEQHGLLVEIKCKHGYENGLFEYSKIHTHDWCKGLYLWLYLDLFYIYVQLCSLLVWQWFSCFLSCYSL